MPDLAYVTSDMRAILALALGFQVKRSCEFRHPVEVLKRGLNSLPCLRRWFGEQCGIMIRKRLAPFVGALFAATFSLHAADPANLADWKLGEVQIGKSVTHEELKGQVVVLDYWGAW